MEENQNGFGLSFLYSEEGAEWRLRAWAAKHPDDPIADDIQALLKSRDEERSKLADILKEMRGAAAQTAMKAVAFAFKMAEEKGLLAKPCKTFMLKPDNKGWWIGIPGKPPVFIYGKLIGMDYIHKLLQSPGKPIHCTKLIGGAVIGERDIPECEPDALASIKKEYSKLKERRDRALSDGDESLAAQCDNDMDGIEKYLRNVTDMGGYIRKYGPGEKTRQSVQKAIRLALEKIRDECPDAYEVLNTQIKTGYECIYTGRDNWDT